MMHTQEELDRLVAETRAIREQDAAEERFRRPFAQDNIPSQLTEARGLLKMTKLHWRETPPDQLREWVTKARDILNLLLGDSQ